MSMQQNGIQPKKYTATLYSVVFDSMWVKCFATLLLAFLLMQPVALAFAQGEEAPTSDPQPSESTEVAENESTPEAAAPAEDVVPADEKGSEESSELQEAAETIPEVQSAVTDEVEVVTDGASEQVVQETMPEDQSSDANASDATEEVNDKNDSSVASGSSTQQEETATTTDISSNTDQTQTETATTTEEVQNENTELEDKNTVEEDTSVPHSEISQETQATTTIEEASSTEAVLIEHNSNAYEFDTKDCASVGDGAFYCSTSPTDQEFQEDGVFAAPDADGDLEIFVRLNGEERQVTSDSIDESAPYYDSYSNRIVWHANINDRYQVVSYDLDSGEEDQLTSTSYNNMEPVAYQDITLWQAWINNNWEIMMHDGKTTHQLTSNTMHDVSPHMRGEYIVWQTQFADGWQVAVYDQKTGKTEYVKSEGGVKVENPRFVLVYDTTNEAGDVQTLGYDFNNKRSFMLNSIPQDVPDELPDPDQTGETRALIQSKQSNKSSELEELEPIPAGGTGTGTSTASSTTSVPDATLDLTASSTPVTASSSPVIAAEDIVVLPAATSTQSVDTSHIPDVVIPPSEATSSAEIS